MKRIRLTAGAAVVAVTMGLAIPALAGTRSYSGTVDPSGEVRFKATIKHGKVRRINGNEKRQTGMTFSMVPADCDGAPSTIGVTFTFPIKVRDHEFHAVGVLGDPADPTATARVRGEFRRHDRRARGTFKAYGDFDGLRKCETGRRDWKARRD
jgi:hypothetical protein